MTPTRLPNLLGLAALLAVIVYVLAESVYTAALPALTPVPIGLLAVTELVMAKLVRDRIRRRPGRSSARAPRPLHPMQIARAAVLAQASSAGGAMVLGGYVGLLAWTLPRRSELITAGQATTVAIVAALASLALVVAALLLERACRAPAEPPDPELGWSL